jgi:hypothetical protein
MNNVDQNRVIWWFEGKRASSFLLLENPVRKKKIQPKLFNDIFKHQTPVHQLHFLVLSQY